MTYDLDQGLGDPDSPEYTDLGDDSWRLVRRFGSRQRGTAHSGQRPPYEASAFAP
jgi:hypothetical protein